MRKVCGDFGAELRAFGGADDHVHLLVEYPPKVAVPALVNSLKGRPARRLRAQFTGRVNRHIPQRHFWSPSYLAVSYGGRSAQHHPDIHRATKAPGRRDFRAHPALNGGACARQFRSNAVGAGQLRRPSALTAPPGPDGRPARVSVRFLPMGDARVVPVPRAATPSARRNVLLQPHAAPEPRLTHQYRASGRSHLYGCGTVPILFVRVSH